MHIHAHTKLLLAKCQRPPHGDRKFSRVYAPSMRETPAPSSVCTRTQVRTARASEVKVQGQFSARWRMHSTGNETTRRHRSCLSLYLSANAVHVVAPLKSCAKPRARRIAMVLETFYVAKRAARWPSWAGGDFTFGCETILRKLPRTLQACTNAAHTHTHTARHSGKPSIYRCV